MSDKIKGKFIAIEGGDGSGKGTVIQALKDEFGEKNVLFTREPGGTKLGDEIREILHRHSEDEMSVLAEILLFYASRAEHLEKKIKPALASGQHVITDRFSLSTLAYQIYGQQRSDYIDKFRQIDQAVVSTNPDLYILLDLDPEVAMARVNNNNRTEMSRFDAKPIDFYRLVRLGYISNIGKYNGKIVDVGEKTPAEVRREVLTIVKNFLEPK